MRRTTTPILLLLCGVAVCLALAACGKTGDAAGSDPKGATGAAGAASAEEAVLVEVKPVEVGPIASVYTSTGTLQADSEAAVKARVRARVRSVEVEEGDRVREGDLLCRLDEEELRIARDKATATAANDKLKYERARKLRDQNLISQEQYQEQEHLFEVSKANAELAELDLSYAAVRAPISGRVSARRTEPGQEVSPGDALFSVVDEDPLRLDLHVPERLVGRLAAGQSVELQLDASGRALQGRIARLAPVVDVSTGTVKVTVEVSADGAVRPGSFARARVVTDLHENALILPRDALVSEGDEWFVFTVADGRARRVPVKLGFEEADRVELAEGPAAGEKVVVAGAPALKDGSPVELLAGAAAKPPEPAANESR